MEPAQETSNGNLGWKILFVILLVGLIFELVFVFLNTNKKTEPMVVTTTITPISDSNVIDSDRSISTIQEYQEQTELFSGNVIKGENLKNPEYYCEDQYYLSFNNSNLRLVALNEGVESWPLIFNKFDNKKINVKGKYSKNDKICELKNIKKCGCDDFLTVTNPESDITVD